MFYPSMLGSNFISSGYALTTATSAENAANEAKTNVEILRHDIDRLLLITEALWTFMKQQHGYTDDALVQLIQDIDSRKNTATGAVAKEPPVACPSCGRPNSVTRTFCVYCGKPLPTKPFAR